MPDFNLIPISGTIQNIQPVPRECCQSMVSVRDENGVQNFIISPETYVIGETQLRPGMSVTAFYDSSLPMPLIYPPQYRTVIIGRRDRNESIAVGYYRRGLVTGNETLRLNISRSTEIVSSNGQRFTCSLENRMVIVYYRMTTRSIPPQTSPDRIIVMC